MTKKIGIEEIIKRLRKTHGSTVEYVSGFTGLKNKALFKDIEFGEFYSIVEHVTRGSGHPKRGILKARKKTTLSIAKVKARLKKIYGESVKIKEETYVSVGKKATFIDSQYGEWEACVNSVLNHKTRHINHKLLSEEKVNLRLKELFNGEVTLKKGTFSKANNKAVFIDNKYGEWEATIHNVIVNKTRHPLHSKLTEEKVESLLQEMFKGTVSLKKGTFKGSGKRATFIDEKYGEWETKAGIVLYGKSRHPSYYSLTEDKINDMLKNSHEGKVVIKKGTYTNCSNKSTFIHEKYGEWTAIASNVIHHCHNHPNAHNPISSLEQKIIDSLSIQKSTDNVLNYLPDFKLSDTIYLDVDGLFYHSEARSRGKSYHLTKRETYESFGFQLLQFRQDEVDFKFPIVQSIINAKLNRSTRVFARKTEIKQVPDKEAQAFLHKTHLMGGIRGVKHIGLYHHSALQCLLSYRVKKDTLVIERFCSELNITVIGGLSKLVSWLEKNVPDVKQVDSWVDLRYGNGKSLEAIGFRKERDILSFRWTDFRNTFNRLHCKAGDGKTEKENAEELGLAKIYDAGQRLYRKTLELKGDKK